MGFSDYSRQNERNLKLRNFYKRYFIWGSKDKPGIELNKKLKTIERLKTIENSPKSKRRLERANKRRIYKIILISLIFLLVYLLTAIFVTLL